VAPEDLTHVFQLFIVALVWGFGAPLPIAARQQYNLFLNNKIRETFTGCLRFKHRLVQNCSPEEGSNLFNMTYQKDKTGSWFWIKLEENLDKYDLSGNLISQAK
jgi:hypothetical protein